ncbi:efflux RND transporter periplasmic adaptor subunit [Qipengyuania soli]|uniref:Efflux RND transporter periplasmic adaptor subunit n=1 Tax=Qipengyuania soli TaxID=2782568 RepID=A0A7S8IWC6_9SPHN|nr:efflux RND transporter periplasmic adaptor subunit [Qipengyuania soli]QPD00531.1 efflux RND transporter periplasmic adaptor subunit [Qipengyuania soli]
MNYETGFETRDAGTIGFVADGEGSTSSGRRKIIAAVVALAALILIAYVVFGRSGTAPTDENEQQLPTVTVVAPGRTTVSGQIVATGTLAARRDMPVGAVGEGGRVIAIPVEAGDWVRQGQVLAIIDRSVQSQQAQSAAAQIQVAQADANLAQANLDRSLKLVERGFVSTADVDRLTATRDAAVARVRVAQAQLRELQARNARLNIVAPAAGLVLERNVEVGQTVAGGAQALFRIARGGEMEMLAKLSESDLANIGAGKTAKVQPVGSEKTFSGQIWQISPTISNADRQGTARIALPYAPELRPGGFATATIESGAVVAPVLPESAVLSDREGAFVYIVDSEGKAKRRPITTGAVTPQGIVVTEGLNGKERVVLRAGGFLTEGETVKPQMAKGS